MKVLSIIASIFLPPTLVAGVYGMNFENMPELTYRWGYFIVLGFMAAVIVAAMSWFTSRRWIVWGRQRAVRVTRVAAGPERIIG